MSSHSCAGCGRDLPTEELRDFAGVPVCVDCYRELGLLTLLNLESRPDGALMAKLLSCEPGAVPAGPRRRFEAAEDFASRMDPAAAEMLALTASRGQAGSGLQEVLWILVAADALLRSGGMNGMRPLDGREMSMLLNLSARVGLDVSWAAMVDAGAATRGLNERGDEWVYEDAVAAAGLGVAQVAAQKGAFGNYIRAVKHKHDLLVDDATGRRDDADIPLTILKRAADEILASISMIERPGGSGRGGAAKEPGPERTP